MPALRPDKPATRSRAATEAIVEDVGFDVAHDSDGLVILTLRFPNGACTQLPLAGSGIQQILEHLDLETIRDLVGRGFSELAPALPANSSK